MTIANVALSDTFDVWRTRTNQLIVQGDQLSTGLVIASNQANTAQNTANNKVASVTGTAGQIYSSGGNTPSLNLISTAVVANTYGGANQIPVITVDAYGRLTSAANVTVQGMDYAYVNTSVSYAYNTSNLAYNQANIAGGGFYRGNNGDKGDANNKNNLFRINYNFLNANTGFDNGENAMTVGPISINISNYLIINTGARVVIV